MYGALDAADHWAAHDGQVLRDAGYTTPELQAVGYAAEELRAAGTSLALSMSS